MKTIKIGVNTALTLLCCILLCTGIAFAANDDTDGTELQVAQPSVLEVQLGPRWAGVEFQLKTDTGLYPGTITVGQDGVLRTELGCSNSYILSCLNSGIAAPEPSEAAASGMTGIQSSPAISDTAPEAGEADDAQTQNKDTASVGGIPVIHLILFGGGLLLAVGALAAMYIIRNRLPAERSQYDFDDADVDEDGDDREY